jgi:hypothetical protein
MKLAQDIIITAVTDVVKDNCAELSEVDVVMSS